MAADHRAGTIPRYVRRPARQQERPPFQVRDAYAPARVGNQARRRLRTGLSLGQKRPSFTGAGSARRRSRTRGGPGRCRRGKGLVSAPRPASQRPNHGPRGRGRRQGRRWRCHPGNAPLASACRRAGTGSAGPPPPPRGGRRRLRGQPPCVTATARPARAPRSAPRRPARRRPRHGKSDGADRAAVRTWPVLASRRPALFRPERPFRRSAGRRRPPGARAGPRCRPGWRRSRRTRRRG